VVHLVNLVWPAFLVLLECVELSVCRVLRVRKATQELLVSEEVRATQVRRALPVLLDLTVYLEPRAQVDHLAFRASQELKASKVQLVQLEPLAYLEISV
jgi:hypothetical protein